MPIPGLGVADRALTQFLRHGAGDGDPLVTTLALGDEQADQRYELTSSLGSRLTTLGKAVPGSFGRAGWR